MHNLIWQNIWTTLGVVSKTGNLGNDLGSILHKISCHSIQNRTNQNECQQFKRNNPKRIVLEAGDFRNQANKRLT
jgi:hypothetical protein